MDPAGCPASCGSFEEFWPFYVSQHRRCGTRALHFVGTTLGFLFLAPAIITSRYLFVL